jgi:hypothetical protein
MWRARACKPGHRRDGEWREPWLALIRRATREQLMFVRRAARQRRCMTVARRCTCATARWIGARRRAMPERLLRAQGGRDGRRRGTFWRVLRRRVALIRPERVRRRCSSPCARAGRVGAGRFVATDGLLGIRRERWLWRRTRRSRLRRWARQNMCTQACWQSRFAPGVVSSEVILWVRHRVFLRLGGSRAARAGLSPRSARLADKIVDTRRCKTRGRIGVSLSS